jgi:hypothetical protein
VNLVTMTKPDRKRRRREPRRVIEEDPPTWPPPWQTPGKIETTGTVPTDEDSRKAKRAAKRAEYAAARAARAARPGRRGWARRGGGRCAWVEPPPEWRGTTVQVCGLYPFAVGASAPAIGVPLGKHQRTAETVCADPVFWFLHGQLNAPCGFVLGKFGLGKSSLVRRILTGLAGFGVNPLVLSDMRPDYVGLIRALGGQVIELSYGHGSINLLDPGPGADLLDQLGPERASRVAAEQEARIVNVCKGLCVLVRGGPLGDVEQSVLRVAVRVVRAETRGRAPVLADLIGVITGRHEEVRRKVPDRGSDERYAELTERLVASLDALGPDGPFGDMFAHATSEPMIMGQPVCFDLSALKLADPELKAAAQLVCWSYGQAGVSAAQEAADAGLAEQSYYCMVIDEFWQMLASSEAMVDRVDEVMRLNREKGLGQILITHTMEDLRLSTDAATAKAWKFVGMSDMVFLGGLTTGEMGNLQTAFELAGEEKELITGWRVDAEVASAGKAPPGRGKFLIKTGKAPGVPLEVALTSVERGVNDTNRRWGDLAERHGITSLTSTRNRAEASGTADPGPAGPGRGRGGNGAESVDARVLAHTLAWPGHDSASDTTGGGLS